MLKCLGFSPVSASKVIIKKNKHNIRVPGSYFWGRVYIEIYFNIKV